eukprot:353449-Rhodomonas_salina.4
MSLDIEALIRALGSQASCPICPLAGYAMPGADLVCIRVDTTPMPHHTPRDSEMGTKPGRRKQRKPSNRWKDVWQTSRQNSARESPCRFETFKRFELRFELIF